MSLELSPISMKPAIQAILFASEGPVSVARLSEIFSESSPVSAEEVLGVMKELQDFFNHNEEFGFEIREIHGGFQFVSKKNFSHWIQRFLELKPLRLGKSPLEVLAIVAYRQPLTRAEIDQIRGIDSSHLLRSLMEKDLIKMVGKADLPGRPVQYGTTEKFLEVVGVKSLDLLPPLTELDEIQGEMLDPIRVLENQLDHFVEKTKSTEFKKEEENNKNLEEIEDLILQAGETKKEIYSSPLEQEIAAENLLASQCKKQKGKDWLGRTVLSAQQEEPFLSSFSFELEEEKTEIEIDSKENHSV